MTFDLPRRPVAVALALAATTVPAVAQQAYLEGATYGGAGNTMVVSRIPVADSKGKITYKNVTIAFSVSAAGTLTAGTPKITTAPIIVTGNFVAGKYKNGSNVFFLSGPGVGPDGRTTWSIESPDCSSFNAGWTTGPVTGHPAEQRLTKVGITYGGISYGPGGGASACIGPPFWSPGSLIGASGGPTGMTLYSYTKSGVDKGAPVQSLSFSLCTAAGC